MLGEQSRDFCPLIMSRLESNSKHSGLPQLLHRLSTEGEGPISGSEMPLDARKPEDLPACFHRAQIALGNVDIVPRSGGKLLERKPKRQYKSVNLRWQCRQVNKHNIRVRAAFQLTAPPPVARTSASTR